MKTIPLGMLLLLAGLTGCQSAAPEAPPVRVKLAADAATVVFFRPTSPPAGVKGILSLDGQEIGRVFVRRYAVINVNPGRHELKFSFPGWVGVPTQTVVMECQPRQKYFLSYTTLMGVGVVMPVAPFVVYSITPELQLVPEEIARPFMERFAVAFVYGEPAPAVPAKPN